MCRRRIHERTIAYRCVGCQNKYMIYDYILDYIQHKSKSDIAVKCVQCLEAADVLLGVGCQN